MKKIFLSIILLAVFSSIYSQESNNKGFSSELFVPNSEWIGIGSVGFGADDWGMSISMDAELGKNIAPKLFLGGGVALNKAEYTSVGIYLSPKYFFSEDISSFYIESSLGLTLFSTVGKYSRIRKGCITSLAFGYMYNKRYSVEIGTTLYGVGYTDHDYSDIINQDYIHLKVSYLLNFKKR